jgi:tetratricopeptide (TPR) repeat protein
MTPESLWRHAVESKPSCYHCRKFLGELLNESGKYDEALVQCREALPMFPRLEIYSIGVVAAQNSGKPELAERYAKAARAFDPSGGRGSAADLFQKGFLLTQAGRSDEALAITRLAAILDPNHPGVQYNLGFFLQSKGLLAESEIHYREAVRLNPSAANAHYNFGVVLAAQGKVAEAIPQCLEAFRLNPSFDAPACPKS